ncbi:hypothetical protein [Pasteurella sp. PK-2025]|uniref:hypothetical protein n=1 Tax=Pasteurella sp. PK-2025 TaxID=3413133 RepID=UPI003C72C244
MKIIEFIKHCQDIKLYDPIQNNALNVLESLNFSKSHLTLLSITDGMAFFGGYFRLFGVNKERNINLFSWNSDELWKYTWGRYIDGYYFFGMSAIGDLFAYGDDNRVYYLDGVTMNVISAYDDFYEFFQAEFIARDNGNVECLFIEARNKFGDLDIDTSLIYIPSLFLYNDPSVDNLIKMRTVDVMTINGDLCRQLMENKRNVKVLEDYIDSNGRCRVKVIFEEDN